MSLKDDAASGLKVLLVSGAAVAVTLAGIPSTAEASVFNFGGERPSNLGVRYGRYLDICPKSPNCISSSADVVSFSQDRILLG